MFTEQEIESFLHGNDPEEFIVAIEFDYASNSIFKVKEIPGKGKEIRKDTFTPFAWVGDLRDINFYGGSKAAQKEAMTKHGIMIDKLETHGNERLQKGMTYIVKSLKGYRELVQFFREGGCDPWGERTKEKVMILPPVEQYLISKEKRLFKGFEDYNQVTRLVFDLETTALEPKDGRIFMIGIKSNKGYHKVIECIDESQERGAIIEFFDIIDQLKPSIIGGYNSANFDWHWIFERCSILNIDPKKICKSLHPQHSFTRKESMLKLANEVEPYTQTSIWGYNVIDIIHAVRRAQAINSSIKSAGLKYITQYINAEAPDRVYIDHLDIGPFYTKKEEYWLNIQNGNYRKVGLDPKIDTICESRGDVYIKTTGDNLVERYLDDDLDETLKVDQEFNQGSFLLAAMIPTTYERVSTMGTATLWKMLMLAWSYKNNLAIPAKESKTDFVGGLSRLLKVGYSKDVLKLDFSSLYPSIQLVHDVFPDCDVTGAMKGMLKWFRDTRIKYKNLAEEYYTIDKKKSESYGNKQLPIKIFINSMFGALSAPQVYAWGDMYMGEQITCTGRQYLRQMIKFFMSKGYVPLVMDTDGVNFSTPQDAKNRVYVGRGGIKMLLKGEGKEFVEYYYEYLQKIFDKQIPLSKIAQRAKVKLSLDEYKKRLTTKTKAGNSMSRMAHMELAIENNLNVNLGDIILYVNNGIKASHGDVQKKGDGVQLNCYMLDKDILDNDPTLTGDYNVPRAIVTFNKRIEPLMVVFKDDVRNGLIVADPEKRGIFTAAQCELINGHPLSDGDQDRLQEDVLDITEQELKYWEKRGLSPYYMYELAEEGWESKLMTV